MSRVTMRVRKFDSPATAPPTPPPVGCGPGAPYNGATQLSNGVSLPEIRSQRERNAHTSRATSDSHSALFIPFVRERRTLGLARLRPRPDTVLPGHEVRARRCAHDHGSHSRARTGSSQVGCCSSEASPFGAPTRCSSWRRPSSATESTGSRTARPAPGPTGSCGSTRCSAPGPSSRCAHPAPTRTVPCRGCASATTSRSTPCASSSSATRRRPPARTASSPAASATA